jgi:hypothetical protein
MSKLHTVPNLLRNWFIAHFWIDILFAIPLFFSPEYFLQLLEWQSFDPVTTRIVAAALFGIGIESYLGRNKDLAGYKGMLRLKIIWSFFASVGILISLLEIANPPIMGWMIFAIFVTFHMVWIYWYRILK